MKICLKAGLKWARVKSSGKGKTSVRTSEVMLEDSEGRQGINGFDFMGKVITGAKFKDGIERNLRISSRSCEASVARDSRECRSMMVSGKSSTVPDQAVTNSRRGSSRGGGGLIMPGSLSCAYGRSVLRFGVPMYPCGPGLCWVACWCLPGPRR